MFIVLLRFSENKAAAAEFMAGHNAWLKQGFDEGVFLLAGSIEPGQGGSIIAYNMTRETLETRVAADPFVSENIVTAEIIEITPKKVDQRFAFLVDKDDD